MHSKKKIHSKRQIRNLIELEIQQETTIRPQKNQSETYRHWWESSRNRKEIKNREQECNVVGSPQKTLPSRTHWVRPAKILRIKISQLTTFRQV